jgi:hypothetical protein
MASRTSGRARVHETIASFSVAVSAEDEALVERGGADRSGRPRATPKLSEAQRQPAKKTRSMCMCRRSTG